MERLSVRDGRRPAWLIGVPMEFSKRLDLLGDEVFAALNVRRRELEAEGRTVYDLSVGRLTSSPRSTS